MVTRKDISRSQYLRRKAQRGEKSIPQYPDDITAGLRRVGKPKDTKLLREALFAKQTSCAETQE